MATTGSSFPKPNAAADAVTDAVVTASRLLIAVSAKAIAAVDESITLAQFRLLVVLRGTGRANVSVVADHLGVNPSAVTRMVDRLVAVDLVNRQVNPASRRELVLDLTAEGLRVVRQVTQQRRRRMARIVARMPERSRARLVDALAAFTDAGGEAPAGEPREEWL